MTRADQNNSICEIIVLFQFSALWKTGRIFALLELKGSVYSFRDYTQKKSSSSGPSWLKQMWTLHLKNKCAGDRPHGQVLMFAPHFSGPGFHWFGFWARTWHRSSGHVAAASHIAQPEGPQLQYTTMYWRGLGRKSRKKKKGRLATVVSSGANL